MLDQVGGFHGPDRMARLIHYAIDDFATHGTADSGAQLELRAAKAVAEGARHKAAPPAGPDWERGLSGPTTRCWVSADTGLRVSRRKLLVYSTVATDRDLVNRRDRELREGGLKAAKCEKHNRLCLGCMPSLTVTTQRLWVGFLSLAI